jgi:DnaJ-class molecular chaperone
MTHHYEPCPHCNGKGSIPDFVVRDGKVQSPVLSTHSVCRDCHGDGYKNGGPIYSSYEANNMRIAIEHLKKQLTDAKAVISVTCSFCDNEYCGECPVRKYGK